MTLYLLPWLMLLMKLNFSQDSETFWYWSFDISEVNLIKASNAQSGKVSQKSCCSFVFCPNYLFFVKPSLSCAFGNVFFLNCIVFMCTSQTTFFDVLRGTRFFWFRQHLYVDTAKYQAVECVLLAANALCWMLPTTRFNAQSTLDLSWGKASLFLGIFS